MALSYDTITFLSDYGLDDEFAGIVRSVIRSIAPGVAVIDLTHDISPYDVRAGGLALARSAPYLCPGVVLAVVDPGVGSERRAIAVEVGEGASVLVGPDNGLLAPAVAMCGGASRAIELNNPDFQLEAVGSTFAGRDVFAPAAAHLCNGVELTELGDLVDPVLLRPGLLPARRLEGDAVVSEVLWVDRYGNAQLNIDHDDLEVFGDRVKLMFGGDTRTARRVDHFQAIGVGEVGLVVDSYGLIAVVVDQGSAATDLDLHPGTEVRVEPFGSGQDAGVTTRVDLGAKGRGR
ncbi:MAG: SAM-dependent chlorinase/fluorinase [Actinobacteria bacterium]|nr:SAM-dependent chlorinase/fluorinase [Actinomycetota bacterium]